MEGVAGVQEVLSSRNTQFGGCQRAHQRPVGREFSRAVGESGGEQLKAVASTP